MSEILPSPLISTAGAVSRPVATAVSAKDNLRAEAVQPTSNVPDRVRDNEDRQAASAALTDPLANLGEKLAELLGDDPRDLRLQIDIDEDADRFIYRSVNKETGEVVRQFPSDELLEIIKSVRETVGLTLDVST